jgi:hypothetical protein
VQIRKLVLLIDEVLREAGRDLGRPTRRIVAAAVITNPLAGRYVEDLHELIEAGSELGGMLGGKAAAALEGAEAESFGKAAIVGMNGELEHAAAVLHPSFGGPAREAIGGGKAIIPSSKKRGAPGCSIDVPLHFKDAAYVRSHFDAVELRLPDAPGADELVVAYAVTDGGRPHPRVGGLRKDEITGEDGLR